MVSLRMEEHLAGGVSEGYRRLVKHVAKLLHGKNAEILAGDADDAFGALLGPKMGRLEDGRPEREAGGGKQEAGGKRRRKKLGVGSKSEVASRRSES
jgi:hypothetical protein